MQEFYALLELLLMLVTDVRMGLLFSLLTAAAWIDWRTHRIPNALTVAGLLIGLACGLLFPIHRGYGFVPALIGLLFGFAATLPLYAMRVMGAGDVKLIAMVGAFVGWPEMLSVLASIFIAGGAMALLYATYHRLWPQLKESLRANMYMLVATALTGQRPQIVAGTSDTVNKFPYGASIAIGTVGYLVLQQIGYLS
jgi:prepilin peptidase CpaA